MNLVELSDPSAQVVKLADTQDLGSCTVTGVQVQILSWANNEIF